MQNYIFILPTGVIWIKESMATALQGVDNNCSIGGGSYGTETVNTLLYVRYTSKPIQK